jgi:hypothetical protein
MKTLNSRLTSQDSGSLSAMSLYQSIYFRFGQTLAEAD